MADAAVLRISGTTSYTSEIRSKSYGNINPLGPSRRTAGSHSYTYGLARTDDASNSASTSIAGNGSPYNYASVYSSRSSYYYSSVGERISPSTSASGNIIRSI